MLVPWAQVVREGVIYELQRPVAHCSAYVAHLMRVSASVTGEIKSKIILRSKRSPPYTGRSSAWRKCLITASMRDRPNHKTPTDTSKGIDYPRSTRRFYDTMDTGKTPGRGQGGQSTTRAPESEASADD